MKNREIANIFYEIADFLEMKEVPFKPSAYRRAALTLRNIEDDVAKIYREGGKAALEKIPGVGESMASKIEEYLKRGKVKYHEDLKREMPVKIEELVQVEGMGPKKVKVLYKKLKVKNLSDLEKAARAHRIAPLFGFGPRTEKNILEGIEFLKKSKGRFLLGNILPQVDEIVSKLKTLKEVNRISVAGSVRRRKETIGDVDLLVVAKNSRKVMDFFVSLPDIVKIWGRGLTRSSIRLKQGFDIDLRVVPEKCYGSALQYFTGSKDHNIITRKIAISKGLKLNEYGVFKGKKMIAGKTEEGVYRSLGMAWMPPEIRTNTGEIEAAIRQFEGRPSGLPILVELKDIRGDLHTHSRWDGGKNTILEMAEAARDRGYEYLGITDHTKFLRIERGLNEKQLSQQRKEIDKLNEELKKRKTRFRILQGAETNILNDGSLDIKDSSLKKLDYVNAGIHSNFKMSKRKMTERIVKAMKNPYVKILVHPTGRILKKREAFSIDLGKIFRAAKQYGVALEVNSFPERLDLNDHNIRRAKELGLKIVINTDSHHKDQLNNMRFGVYQARRGWAEKGDVINTWPLRKLLNFFKAKHYEKDIFKN